MYILGCFLWLVCGAAYADTGQLRTVQNDRELKAWLENMVWHHGYSIKEIGQVVGMAGPEVKVKLKEFNISPGNRPKRPLDKMFVLPYPGGRHPRIGFLEGAIEPQRETKLSIFAPWDQHSYSVLDVPEAIWSNLGLTYLAHTHIDTIWTKQNIELKQLEWERTEQGQYQLVRTLPNGIEFGVKVQPLKNHLRMKMWLTNGTDQPLSDLRVQNCVMLKSMAGFDQLNNENKIFRDGYAVAFSGKQSSKSAKWIISSWDPLDRAWGNQKCPCLHSDPKFPDCEPGETQWLRGWFSFYEGNNLDAELERIESTGWRTHPLHHATGNLVGKVVDADSGVPVPCRLYVQSLEDQSWHFATSTAVAGSAVKYDKQLGKSASIERHTTLSAHGFQLDVPPGRYRIRAQRGKETLPDETVIEVTDTRANVILKLQRFADMASRGWYSGDTHVHRAMEELPNAVLAEDLNVALPLSFWVRDSTELPAQSGPKLESTAIQVDATHLIYPINTEYEIFSVDGKRHTQGAVFVLNHTQPLTMPAPPVRRIAAEARRQGAILDLDKHSWNWSAMIVPIMKVDLFELSNNHHWRTNFGFPKWTLENSPPNWPEIETTETGFTERGWTEFGFQTYYAFLNCGYRMRVSAGTASGVHPVPLGHGRVYVHLGTEAGNAFSHQKWMEQLNRGHSFVTQGPLMDLKFNGELPGKTWNALPEEGHITISGTIESVQPLHSIQVVNNGVATGVVTESEQTALGNYITSIEVQVPVNGTCWLALRCFETAEDNAPQGKVVFAHTNPVFVDVAGQPLQPRQRDVRYFLKRINAELDRNRGILSEEAMAEFQEAKEIYERLMARTMAK